MTWYRRIGPAILVAVGLAPTDAYALPTMVRLNYGDCVTCHVAPQGGGVLTDYGRLVDDAQSLRAGAYAPSGTPFAKIMTGSGRIRHDLRLVAQAEGVYSPHDERLPWLARVVYRNSTEIVPGVLRIAVGFGVDRTGVVAEAPTPAKESTPPSFGPLFVSQAVLSVKLGADLEILVGRDALPTGVNVPDLALFVRARNQEGFANVPLQAKLFWATQRSLVVPYAFGPTFQEEAGTPREWGAGVLAEVDVAGRKNRIFGINALVADDAEAARGLAGGFARLGFGRWGILGEADVGLSRGAAPTTEVTTYLHGFFAVREWLVWSVATESAVSTSQDGAGDILAAKTEAGFRLTPNLSLSARLREQLDLHTRVSTTSAWLQIAMKTGGLGGRASPPGGAPSARRR